MKWNENTDEKRNGSCTHSLHTFKVDLLCSFPALWSFLDLRVADFYLILALHAAPLVYPLSETCSISFTTKQTNKKKKHFLLLLHTQKKSGPEQSRLDWAGRRAHPWALWTVSVCICIYMLPFLTIMLTKLIYS